VADEFGALGDATAKLLRVRYFDLIFQGGPALGFVNLEPPPWLCPVPSSQDTHFMLAVAAQNGHHFL
jgi:hypothetical protein